MVSTPVFIIGGYLGAGKTSLVNQILQQAAGQKLAVIVNDFGAVNIDVDLILARDEQVIELSGGCLCCRLDQDLSTILMDLSAQRSQFDAIIVEASGVARPATLAATIPLIESYHIGGVIVLCDCGSILRQMTDRYIGDLVCDQLSAGDLIILNKIDLVPDSDITSIQAQIVTLSPAAKFFAASHAQVPLDVIFLAHQILKSDNLDRQPAQADIIFVSAVLEGPMVNAQDLAKALTGSSIKVHRAKGFVYDRNKMPMVLQVAGDQWSVTPAASLCRLPTGALERQTSIVCIGARGEMDLGALRRLADQFHLQVRI
jgi:G3E family GTPase